MWGHARACMAPNTNFMHRLLSPLSRVEAVAPGQEQARCEVHLVARRVGGPSRAAADEPKFSGGGDRVLSLSARVDPKKPTYFTGQIEGYEHLWTQKQLGSTRHISSASSSAHVPKQVPDTRPRLKAIGVRVGQKNDFCYPKQRAWGVERLLLKGRPWFLGIPDLCAVSALDPLP
jgi:hypothetical protein